ncbi:MAG: cytosine permease [Propionibacteriaceae bacterium]|jgi:cytosine permease|nr:cytosine permease [Propionibacteriaceae bacterium]
MSAETAEIQQAIDSDYSLEAVPKDARRGFWAVGFVMLGFTFFSASMWVGTSLGTGFDLAGYCAVVILGGAILAVYTGFLGYIGADTGLSMDLMAQRAFGLKGSFLPSALISLTQMGWFGVGVAMLAIPISDQLGISPWWIIIIGGAAMTASAYYGIRAIEWVSFVSVPLIVILGLYSMGSAIADTPGGLESIFSKSDGLSLLTGVAMVVGSFISGGTATPNFTRFAASTKSAVVTTVVAFFVGNTLMFTFGAVAGAFTGQNDIFYALIAQGLLIPAIIVLGGNIWTTNNNALYTTGLGFSNITKIRKRPLVLVAGILGTVLAMWLYDNFVTWLNVLNATLPPVGAILIADYFRHRENYRSPVAPDRQVNVSAVVAVIAGGAVGNFLDWGITSINAMVVAVAIYFVGEFAAKAARK